jgi:glucose-1-phosphate adenylyltransferase
MHTNLIILAAGASSRMKNSETNTALSEDELKHANTKSKALIGIGASNRPLLDYLLINAEKAGYKNIYLIVGEDASTFKNHYGFKKENNFYKGLQISYATQFIPKERIKPLGTADAVFQTLEQYPFLQKESFTVCNSDNLYSVKALKSIRENSYSNALISYDRDGLIFSLERVSKFALMEFDSENYLKDIIEKPPLKETKRYRDAKGKYRVSMNLFKFNGTMFFSYLADCPIHKERNEKELPTALLNMCKDFPIVVKSIPFLVHVQDLNC